MSPWRTPSTKGFIGDFTTFNGTWKLYPIRLGEERHHRQAVCDEFLIGKAGNVPNKNGPVLAPDILGVSSLPPGRHGNCYTNMCPLFGRERIASTPPAMFQKSRVIVPTSSSFFGSCTPNEPPEKIPGTGLFGPIQFGPFLHFVQDNKEPPIPEEAASRPIPDKT